MQDMVQQDGNMLVYLLRQILQGQHDLLGRQDELAARLDAAVPPAFLRDYAPLRAALIEQRLGGLFLQADQQGAAEKASVQRQALQILLSANMSAQQANFVIDTVVAALGWYDEQVPQPVSPLPQRPVSRHVVEPYPVQPSDMSVATASQPIPPNMQMMPETSSVWCCRCGQAENHGRFCIRCGTSREQGEVDDAAFWDCICGQQGNHANFCISCGRSRAQGEVYYWRCACGQHNKGNFCTVCGIPRPANA